MTESVNNWYAQLLLQQLFLYQHLLGNNIDYYH